MVLLRHCAPRVLFAMGLIFAAAASASALTLRAWVSDEQCARGRAGDGIYTGTNPDCAKKCIADGNKTVLIDSDHKRILMVENPAAVKQNIGDYVEIEGSLDSSSNLVHVTSLKMIEKGAAMCGRESHRPAKPNGK